MKKFILLMAYLNAMVAMSIDAMLPALHAMSVDLRVERYNDIQFVIGGIFAGMTVGQIFAGPLADAIGRKKALFFGIGLYLCGTLLCWLSQSLPVMLAGRVLQGLGVAAPRIVSTAVIRDKFHGRDMAYIMSMVMGVFIMLPAIAPTVGQLVIHFLGWRSIFEMYAVLATIAALWFHYQMDETLAPENRHGFNVREIVAGYKEAARTRITLGYTLACGLAFGAILGYLTSAQQIFQETFGAGEEFAIYFGILALGIGAAFFSNSALVRKYGMRKITRTSLNALVTISIIFLPYVLLAEPTLVAFMIFMFTAFFCLGLMFGNMNAMAMEPMGHMAGLGSGFVGAGSSLISISIGTGIGQLYNGTLLPLSVGFVLLSLAAKLTMEWTERAPNPRA